METPMKIQNGEEQRVEMDDIPRAEQNGKSPQEAEAREGGCFRAALQRAGSSTEQLLKGHKAELGIILKFAIHGVVFGYLGGCIYYWYINGQPGLALCSGLGSFVALLAIVYFFIIYFKIVKPYLGGPFHRTLWKPLSTFCGKFWKFRLSRYCACAGLLLLTASLLYWDTRGQRHRLIPLLGLVFLLGIGFAASAHPARVSWRAVWWGLALQVLFGVATIRWPVGRNALQCFGDKVSTFLGYGVEGSAFVFGDLLVKEERVFAFSTLPVIFFFAMIVEMLFYWGALQWFCLKLGSVLQSVCRTTVCESVIVVGNIFLGNTESALIIKPYVALLTESEIHTVMASGFATVSGTILAAYIGFGAEPAHLITASVMSAPAALCYAKLVYPEVHESKTSTDTIQPIVSEDQSTLAAATRGAGNGISLLLNIIANLVAFIALVAFVNGLLGYFGGLLGFPTLSLEWIFGKVFVPLSWLMGVPWEECEMVGTLIGLKTVVNEFVAYQRMGEFKAQGLLSVRAETIATYAMCGFTNPGSAGIMIGALSAMAPNQRETLSKVAFRAFFAGCGICFMTASIAGVLMPEGAFAPPAA